MSLTERAKMDMQSITSNTRDWGVTATLTDLTGETATVVVLHTRHNTAYTPEGELVNVPTASVAISDVKVLEANPDYSYLNSSGEITYMGHSLNVADAAGNVKNYVVSENYPDEKLGMTILILQDKG